MSVPFTLEGGEAGELLAFAGEAVTLLLPRAFAPGAPFRGAAEIEGAAVPVEAKSRGSRRQADGRFTVTGRCINLRRTTREALSSALPAVPSPDPAR